MGNLRQIVKTAFLSVRQTYSTDRVVVDPALNTAFINKARELGATETIEELNRCLYNLRKAGQLTNLQSVRPKLNHDEYQFAVEMAVRFLEQAEETTLDRILCNPELVQRMDALAAELAPGFTPLQYRLAALSLRKKRKLQPELLTRLVGKISVQRHQVRELDLNTIPTGQGVYLFICPTDVLYVGEAENLFLRLKKHLDHSDNKLLARRIWELGADDLQLELHLLPDETSNKARKALESSLIASRHPIFNRKP